MVRVNDLPVVAEPVEELASLEGCVGVVDHLLEAVSEEVVSLARIPVGKRCHLAALVLVVEHLQGFLTGLQVLHGVGHHFVEQREQARVREPAQYEVHRKAVLECQDVGIYQAQPLLVLPVRTCHVVVGSRDHDVVEVLGTSTHPGDDRRWDGVPTVPVQGTQPSVEGQEHVCPPLVVWQKIAEPLGGAVHLGVLCGPETVGLLLLVSHSVEEQHRNRHEVVREPLDRDDRVRSHQAFLPDDLQNFADALEVLDLLLHVGDGRVVRFESQFEHAFLGLSDELIELGVVRVQDVEPGSELLQSWVEVEQEVAQERHLLFVGCRELAHVARDLRHGLIFHDLGHGLGVDLLGAVMRRVLHRLVVYDAGGARAQDQRESRDDLLASRDHLGFQDLVHVVRAERTVATRVLADLEAQLHSHTQLCAALVLVHIHVLRCREIMRAVVRRANGVELDEGVTFTTRYADHATSVTLYDCALHGSFHGQAPFCWASQLGRSQKRTALFPPETLCIHLDAQGTKRNSVKTE